MNKKDLAIAHIESLLDTECISLKEDLELLLKDYKRKTNRLDKIIK